MEDEGHDGSADDEKLDSKGVMNAIIGMFVALQNEVDGEGRGGEEEDLHDGVVKREGRVPRLGEEEIKVACGEDYHVQDLSLE